MQFTWFWGLGFQGLGFQGLGFQGLGFRVSCECLGPLHNRGGCVGGHTFEGASGPLRPKP